MEITNNKNPILTVLNFSGGQQSSALLWMVINKDIPKPDNFLVLNADPGMENSKTYEYVNMMFKLCKKNNIEAFTVKGPNLYKDLLDIPKTIPSRFDNPPYWTKSKEGKKGKLRQKCTKIYKIAPMDRAIRQYLEDNFSISKKTKRLGTGIVRKWIGFAYDEVFRIKPSDQKYIEFEYPLVEKKMNREEVKNYFEKNKLPIPPRSVCNACFANGLNYFKEMRKNRPKDFQQAVNVDNAIRNLSCIGVRDEVFVSNSLIPLNELDKAINSEDADNYSCDSGYCFT